MRILLQTSPTESTNPRFYHLFLQQDLIEGWALIRETGRQGAPGKVTHQHFEKWDDAQAAMLELRDKQLKRGYRVVFVQGVGQP
jgi:predicted DNA-binding WGR domain protein